MAACLKISASAACGVTGVKFQVFTPTAIKDRIAELKATRDQARLDAERAEEALKVDPCDPAKLKAGDRVRLRDATVSALPDKGDPVLAIEVDGDDYDGKPGFTVYVYATAITCRVTP